MKGFITMNKVLFTVRTFFYDNVSNHLLGRESVFSEVKLGENVSNRSK